MAFAHGFSACFGCNQPFTYNPMRVPSVRIAGIRHPICRQCVERANPQRIARGLNPIAILPDAYEACDESELVIDSD